MISNCANPDCGKPLHYLREGRIYIFNTPTATVASGKTGQRRLEHYWLCGVCMEKLTLAQDGQGRIHLLKRRAAHDCGDSVTSTARTTRLAS